MCGINGILKLTGEFDLNSNKEKVKLMNSIIKHRGPDSEGIFANNELVLGFRRLSIIDITSAADQPFRSFELGLVIVFNGEIYNYKEIRNELINYGYKFNSNSDTEVILAAYHKFGVDCVSKFNGMWAFAIYDEKTGVIFISRDRLGVKPFYYTIRKNLFIFSSEMKAIIECEDMRIANRNSVFNFLAFGYNNVGNCETFINGIFELSPGTSLIIKDNKVVERKYWELIPNMYNFENNIIDEELSELFMDSLSIRYRSDVPVGLLLSGGLDSSIIAKCTADLIKNGKLSSNKINAFIAHFPGYELDELKIAKSFVKDLEQIDLNVIEVKIEDIIPKLNEMVYGLDIPTNSFSHFVHCLLMSKVKENKIKVTMNGQGADESFYGYDKHIIGYFLLDRLLLRKGDILRQIGKIHSHLKFGFPMILSQLFKALVSKKSASFYRAKYIEQSIQILQHKQFKYKSEKQLGNYNYSLNGNNLQNYSIEHIKSVGLNNILKYEDSSSMINSVEMRSPFLDYRLVEFAFSIPDQSKFYDGITKKILREKLGNGLPENIRYNSKKIGFSSPFMEYMKHPLMKEYISDIVHSNEFMLREIWDGKLLLSKYTQSKNNQFPYWRFLNFEIWCQKYKIRNV